MQRAVIKLYRQIATNENAEFLALIKQLFQIDGLLGQLFVVTHSTDALVDDYVILYACIVMKRVSFAQHAG